MRRLAALLTAAALLAITAGNTAPAARAEDDLVHITSHVIYDIHPDQGPVRVSWDITIQNNDPATKKGRGSNSYFYDNFAFPLLVGASSVTARSVEGADLDITVDEPGQGPAIPARVKLDKQLFYQDTYTLRLEYQVAEARHPALVVMPAYAFVPLIAGGDEATVDVTMSSDAPWTASLEAGSCAQSGNSFSCSGSDAVWVAAVAEVARQDLTATLTTEVQLRDQKVPVTITYFQGEDAFARHISDLATAALPVMEDLYGLTYFGPQQINVAERVRQVILGYEGLTSCDPATACDVNISPIADDYTILHELAHLWSNIYDERWLSEGFAQFVSVRAVAYLPPDLVTGTPPIREQPTTDLQLDDWGEVQSVIGATEAELAVENTGYSRSQRFLEQLDFELGLEALRRTNQVIGESGAGADSRRFMDILEDVTSRDNDALFQEWVFPNSYDTIIADRRDAHDRLTNLIARAQEEGLSEGVPDGIQEKVDAWTFDDARIALDEAEAGLETYDALKTEIEQLRTDVAAGGLELADTIDELITDWEFEAAQATVAQAAEALASYEAAQETVDAPRSPWKRFGMLGSDPEGSLEAAAAAFNEGDYMAAADHAQDAVGAVNGADRTAVRRVLILAGILGVFALVILAAVWLSHRSERELA